MPATLILLPHPVPTLRGELITLRAIDLENDIYDYFQFNADPEMHHWTGNSPFSTIDEAHAELARLASLEDVSTWMIIENATGGVVGRFFLCLEIRDGIRVVGDGNRIARHCWRKGHNREARMIMLQHAFDVLQADVYETSSWADNINSCRSIESMGFYLVDETEQLNPKYNRLMLKRRYCMKRKEAGRTTS